MIAYCCVPTILARGQPHGRTGFPMAAQTFRDLYVLLYAVARLGVWLAIFAAVFVPIERLFALHGQKIFRKGIAVDLGYYFLSGLLPGLVLGPPISVAVLAIHHFIPGGVLGAIAVWPIWLKACATMMVGETAYYWAPSLESPNSVPLAVSRHPSQRGAARFPG